ncbi:F0F1 ATP synthase subunit A [Dehalococcoidia bacterium]|nr:F0F1 ATP synthase subunit A [Dehalococcoidia bacterium]
MGKLFANPKILIILLIFVASLLLSVLGGALGASFGLGFLGGPVPFISVPAERVFSENIFGYHLLNSTIMFWVSGILLTIFAWISTRKMGDVPGRMQNLLEIIIEFFSNLADSVAGGGKKSGRIFLPVVTIIFLIVLFTNWVGILPGVGSIGRIETIDEWMHHHVEKEQSDLSKKYPNTEEEKLHDLAVLHFLLEEHSETFVVFEKKYVNYVPLGSGESNRVPLEGIVDYDKKSIEDILHQLESDQELNYEQQDYYDRIKHDIEEGVVKGNYDELNFDSLKNWNQSEGKKVGILVPFLRGASTDLNTPLAIALVAVITVQIWGFKALGFKGYGSKFIVNPIKNGPINSFVGILELLGEFTRAVSFTFRLFGNMFAGEILLIAMAFLFPLVGIIPFMGMELFVGAIQAFIFAMLTLVFGVMAVASHGAHDKESEDH